MNLKEIAKAKGTNIKRLAESCGIPASTVYAISSGDTNADNVGIGVTMKLAAALDMTVDELYAQMSGFEYAVVQLPAEETVSSDERELLELYRRMDPAQRLAFMEVARSMAVASEKDGAR